eukprot:TRINITY_DN60736_c0_g1_i1.p1 TRINITY_DN60736_c0_g1~~TRINITY_DN60736_c0_g1_i1.p1  ORF type:complete len:465 (+),score=138.30 TRINITY_DN60736_c0_g1_i1:70-1395(+)
MVGGAAAAAQTQRRAASVQQQRRPSPSASSSGGTPGDGTAAVPAPVSLAACVAIFLLYAVQGVPFGVVDSFLPLMMYGEGHRLEEVGLVGMIGMPWMFKWLWAPLIDSTVGARFGQYKTWIVPAHLAMLSCCALCALVPRESWVTLVVLLLLLWALATAVEDCAVDGLTMAYVELGKAGGQAGTLLAVANCAQVVGFKLGLLYAGAPLWQVYGAYGWGPEMWIFLGAPVAAVLAISLSLTEPRPARAKPREISGRLMDVAREARSTFRSADMQRLMLLAVLYKAGEKVLMVMFKPYLVDAGHSPQVVGTWVGTYGTVTSLLSSAIGAAALHYAPARRVLQASLAARALCQLASVTGLLPPQLAIAAQGFGSGLVTPVMFGYLMEAVSSSPCAVTCYTVLQCGDDLSRFVGHASAGFLAANAGYPATFACGLLASAAPLLLV